MTAPRCAHSWGPRVVEMLADRTQHVHVHCCTKQEHHVNNRHLCRCGDTIVKRKAREGK